MNKARKPIIGVTIGDPSGVGPEIACKAVLDPYLTAQADIRLIGYPFIIEHAFSSVLHTEMPEGLSIIEPEERMFFPIEYGRMTAEYGRASMLFVERGVRLAQSGEIDAVTTCPINKHSIQLAGYPYPGHTEFLGALTESGNFSMMLVGGKVRVVLATTHVPMAQLAQSLTAPKILTAIVNAHQAGKFFGFSTPKIAVCGLNPHAGDNGTLGNEEQLIITPAIEAARADGIDARGPYPADALFAQVAQGLWDFVVVMYHDQGLIPVKMQAFGDAVNVTLNLPIIRTSVDHGTAFDIAGKNIATHTSLTKAVLTAAEMVKHGWNAQ